MGRWSSLLQQGTFLTVTFMESTVNQRFGARYTFIPTYLPTYTHTHTTYIPTDRHTHTSSMNNSFFVCFYNMVLYYLVIEGSLWETRPTRMTHGRSHPTSSRWLRLTARCLDFLDGAQESCRLFSWTTFLRWGPRPSWLVALGGFVGDEILYTAIYEDSNKTL